MSAALLIGAPPLVGASAAMAAPTSAPISGSALEVTVSFSFDKKATRRAASGIACRKVGAVHRCLVAFDEGVEAQWAEVSATQIKAVGEPLRLLASEGELDAEGAAIDGDLVYVTGSHSGKRKNCAANPLSRYVVRMKLTTPTTVEHSTKLWEILGAHPLLKAHAGGCLGADGASAGINIEGIAARDGQLYFGFRGPSIDGVVPVLSVSAQALFSNTTPAARVDWLRVGTDLGIRDILATPTTLLLLIGPDDHGPPKASRWLLAEWKQGSATAADQPQAPRVLAELDIGETPDDHCSKEVKPEAMALLDETPTHYRVLVLSDGLCDGGPRVYSVPR